MRNSFNTAGFSEVVHEIRNDPAEADFWYTAKARSSPSRGLSVDIGPALFGTIKSARSFRVEVGDPADGPCADAPLPLHLALTGIASCALTTLVGGGSSQNVVFDSADMELTCRDGAYETRVAVGGVPEDKVVADLLDQVEQFSPNYRTLTQHVPVALGFGSRPLPGADGAEVAAGRTVACRVRWISGTQLLSRPLGEGCGPDLRVDAPKQLTGVDWGPNPQEYLLMGLAADVAAQLGRLSRADGRYLTWEVSATGREDIGGLLQADPAAVVHLQDVACAVAPPRGAKAASESELTELVRTAFAHSEVRDLISRARSAGLAWQPQADTPVPSQEPGCA
ncbi:OsmC family protein [Streptomyces catenulae]|uniref:OsmC family protein n=1 Tax=Streptomyces catenulae TaxID=66875 RepID=A0ABV2YZ75_9ACTN|nr:OsmC family protein [Streptomyces catenulae]